MRTSLITISILISLSCFSQNIVFGDSAKLWVGSQASFFAGGNTAFTNELTNNGTVVSYSDLDFVNNRDVGSLKFVGVGDQVLSGDSLDVVDIEVDKPGNSNVVLMTEQVVVSGMLNVTNGVIQSMDSLDLLVSGGSSNIGDGYVEGKLVGLSTGAPVTFPVGIAGAGANYVTLANTTTGTIFQVECVDPIEEDLIPEEDVKGVFDEVEWQITALGDPTEATLTIDFAGLDATLANSQVINSDGEAAAIAVLEDGDSLFRVLRTASFNTATSTIPPNFGTIESADRIQLTEKAIRVAIVWVPVATSVKFFIPNSFAPGGFYEENRIFRPYFAGEDVTRVDMVVYNSLNQEVYSVAIADPNVDLTTLGWNGVLPSGQNAPAGVYYYSINLTSTSNTFAEAGAVLLVR